MTNGALVLAGGGLAGIAWELGVLAGIEEENPQAAARIIGSPTTLIGTSAGSAVAAQLAGGTPLAELFAAQVAPESAEIFVDVDLAEFGATVMAIRSGATSPEDARKRFGQLALNADTVSPELRRAAIEGRLSVKTWGDRDLRLTAVDVLTGEPRIFDRDSGVTLAEAVEASCAIPGIWPVVELDGHRYMDGGMRTIANADFAVGHDPILILVPQQATSPLGTALSDEELAVLAPSRVHVIYADEASVAAFGSNPLDPAGRGPAAWAGREVGRKVAAEVAAFWG